MGYLARETQWRKSSEKPRRGRLLILWSGYSVRLFSLALFYYQHECQRNVILGEILHE